MGLTLFGAGGHAKVVIAAARAMGLKVTRILDDRSEAQGTEIMGVPVTGIMSEYQFGAAFIGIGSNQVRKRLDLAYPNAEWVSIVHPAAYIDPTVTLAPGVLVCAGAVIQPETILGRHVIVNTSASIDHECILEQYSQVGPGAHLGGRVTLGEGSMAGIGSSIHQGYSMGPWSMLGGNGFLKDDLPWGVTAVGIPAKPLAKR